MYVNRAVSIIESHASAATGPFFLYMAFSHMHTPLAYNTRFSNSSTRSGYSVHFGNALFEVDDSVGQIIQALDDYGLRNNTLVILTSDNGPADLGSVHCIDVGSVGPFSGLWQRHKGGGGSTSKATVWEGGHHVVGIANWPGRIKGGAVSNELTSTVDILPTLASLADLKLPADREYDGIDISSILFGYQYSSDNYWAGRTLCHPSGDGDLSPEQDVPAMRVGKYKILFGETFSFPSI